MQPPKKLERRAEEVSSNLVHRSMNSPERRGALLPGETIGEGPTYLVESLIAMGGFAEVYRVRDLETGVVRALKTLQAKRAVNPRLVDKLRAEGFACSVLNHPNIVKVFDIGVDRGCAYFVMELLEGCDLRTIMNRPPRLDPVQALYIAQEMADFLYVLHHAGIVHRDVKPENCFITHEGHVKGFDLGAARFERFGELRTSSGAIPIGTSLYMAPEQWNLPEPGRDESTGRIVAVPRRSFAKPDHRIDCYAWGLMLWEMLAGVHAAMYGNSHQTRDLLVIGYWHTFTGPPPLRDVVSGLPDELYALVDKAIGKSPRQRFDTMAQPSALLGEIRLRMAEKRSTHRSLAQVVLDARSDQLGDPHRAAHADTASLPVAAAAGASLASLPSPIEPEARDTFKDASPAGAVAGRVIAAVDKPIVQTTELKATVKALDVAGQDLEPREWKPWQAHDESEIKAPSSEEIVADRFFAGAPVAPSAEPERDAHAVAIAERDEQNSIRTIATKGLIVGGVAAAVILAAYAAYAIGLRRTSGSPTLATTPPTVETIVVVAGPVPRVSTQTLAEPNPSVVLASPAKSAVSVRSNPPRSTMPTQTPVVGTATSVVTASPSTTTAATPADTFNPMDLVIKKRQ
jgi:serine/threonine protein kinase